MAPRASIARVRTSLGTGREDVATRNAWACKREEAAAGVSGWRNAMARLTDPMEQGPIGSPEVQVEMRGITGRFEAVLASCLPPGSPGTILGALTPPLDAHPGLCPGLALYWLRRQAAS